MSVEALPVEIISDITTYRGMMWEKIAEFSKRLEQLQGVVKHKAGDVQSKEMQELFPLKQHIASLSEPKPGSIFPSIRKHRLSG